MQPRPGLRKAHAVSLCPVGIRARREPEQNCCGDGSFGMTSSRKVPSARPDPAPQIASQPIGDHDMELSLPVDAPRNVVRKRQQRAARSLAGRHIDAALSELPISDQAKASRKAKLIELPDDTPVKRLAKRPRSGPA